MLIWSGSGILVLVIVGVCVFFSNIFTGQLAADPDYFDLHGWPMGAGILAAAVICWFLGRHLRASGAQTLIDPNTRQPVTFYRRHTLFFIPMHWWGLILAFIALPMLGTHKTPEQLSQDRRESALRKQEKAAARELRRPIRDKSSSP